MEQLGAGMGETALGELLPLGRLGAPIRTRSARGSVGPLSQLRLTLPDFSRSNRLFAVLHRRVLASTRAVPGLAGNWLKC